jgi:hypothetical protein
MVALSLSAPKSYGFTAVAAMRLTKFGEMSKFGLSNLWFCSRPITEVDAGALPALEICREIHREDAKSAKNTGELNYNPLPIRWMPSLIRATFQFTRKPSRWPESVK